ncbi:hypothetical protein WJX73_000011 [Symbiochloris irregularis]|uniref:Uncharacterized protein n=1 Tax=Symbiochloris irregularis TaxID=706552 RepID=A0AAW1PL87_9CHLO
MTDPPDETGAVARADTPACFSRTNNTEQVLWHSNPSFKLWHDMPLSECSDVLVKKYISHIKAHSEDIDAEQLLTITWEEILREPYRDAPPDCRAQTAWPSRAMTTLMEAATVLHQSRTPASGPSRRSKLARRAVLSGRMARLACQRIFSPPWATMGHRSLGRRVQGTCANIYGPRLSAGTYR